MSVWTLLLTILGWVLVVLVVSATAVVIAGFVLYIIKVVKAARARSKRAKASPEVLSDEAVTELAADYWRDQQKGQLDLFEPIRQAAFMRGVRLALSAKKGDTDADRI